MEQKKKGIFSLIKDSLVQTGGCCGPGESCGPSGKPSKEKDLKKINSNVGSKK